MSFQSLNERLTTLLNTTAQITELIERLGSLRFQPGSIPLEGEEGDVSHELSSEISQTLREQDEDLEILIQEVRDFYVGRAGSERARQRDRLEETMERALDELKTSRVQFRQAQLTAKRNIEAAQRQERELLLASLADPSRPNSPAPSTISRKRNRDPNAELSKEEKELQAASDVTAALRRTHQMMQNELSRSQFAHDTLKESTAALSQLSESYSTLDTMLAGSKNLLSTLVNSQKSDTWYLQTALLVLSATVGWLIFRRFIYGPGWWIVWGFPKWFVWIPMKMFYKAWMGVFVALGIRDNRDGGFAETSSVLTNTRKPLITHSQAVRARHSGRPMQPPNVNIAVGAGGYGARVGPDGQRRMDQKPVGASEPMIDKVSKIIDESAENAQENSDEHVPEEGVWFNDGQGNPMKRMWEEDVEAGKQERRRDEL